VAGHIALLAIAWFIVNRPMPPQVSQAFEVSYVDEVGLTSASPEPSTSAPAATAPDVGPVEDASPEVGPEPAVEPAPPTSTPRQTARPSPAPPPRPAAAQPRPQPTPARNPGRQNRRPGLGDLNPDNFGRDPAARPAAPPAQMTGQARANIAQAIQRRVQPCADRQINPGPGAERIATEIVLSLNADGSLAARPRAGRQTGVDDENRRYAARVADLAIASFVGCSPLRGLPAELYDVPNGWRNFTLRYRLPA
jgi:outer membrane biosynthesis protein TonB